MKVVLYKPYVDIWFKNPVRRVVSGQVIPSKYEPFFDFLLNSSLRLMVSTRLIFSPGWRGKVEMFGDVLRILLWLLVHRIMPWRVGWVFNRKQFNKSDIAFFMHYGNFSHEQEILAKKGEDVARFFGSSDVFKIVHMTHFAYNSSIGAENLQILGPDLLVAENDLVKNSPFFIKQFGNVSVPFLCLPFVPAGRFIMAKPLASRIHKLFVTGSITYKMCDPDFLEFYRDNELQPMRRKIYDERDRLSNTVDCLIFDLDEARRLEATAASLEAIRKSREEAMAKQRAYYDADIVELFNRYAMFAVPEEVCGLPGIGFIEGMACGTAYFGLDDPMYRDIGMEPGVHYVAYDGTIDGLVAKVTYYQKHFDELTAIAERGYRFAHEQMNAGLVYSHFMNKVEDLRRSA